MITLEEGTPTEILITTGFSDQWEVSRRCHFDSSRKKVGEKKTDT